MTDLLISTVDLSFSEAMTRVEAEQWARHIGTVAGDLRALLFEGFNRRAWFALGYSSWTDCIRSLAEEYGFSERHIWRLHGANETENLLTPGSVGSIPEKQLRPLTSLPPDIQPLVWQLAVETAPDGRVTARHVEDTVKAWQVAPEKRPVSYHVSDDSYEWYTPTEYIEAARRVMGSIDLDPATSEQAQAAIMAGEYYTKDNDGLSYPWFGNVWLNPPYNMPLIEQFVDRIIGEYERGTVTSAIVLTNNSTDTGWFHKLAQYPFCLTRGRIQFWNGDERLATRQGQALFYLGNDPAKFAGEFARFGLVVNRYDNPEPGRILI